ncbi:hypothetical protein electrica_01842 [Klebsiella electrica]|nr:hypothetical protein electrica_01842 [Klebsiella electrica]
MDDIYDIFIKYEFNPLVIIRSYHIMVNGNDAIFTGWDKRSYEVYSVINGNKISLSDISSGEKPYR